MTIGFNPVNSNMRQSGTSPFRARARLIRLLGEELISDEVMAVVELVKNGYDADGHQVRVQMNNITDPENGEIRILDDGCGMDLDTVLHSWMEPATHHKRPKNGVKVRTPRGRIQLGEKGVGRFAADKLGATLEIVTRKAGEEDEVVLRVGWQHFDHDRYLDEVESTWFTREPVEFAGSNHGTLLIIRSLRAKWNKGLVERIYTGLMRLVTPFSTASSDFTIKVDCTEFPEISGQVINPLLETAPYRLVGQVDEKGLMTIRGDDKREIDLKTLAYNYFVNDNGEAREPDCGPFSVSVNIWDLEPINKVGTGVDVNRRKAVKAYSGVSIYRDGFRIWPYGEKDDDWLELNLRRINNPTMRVSNNQVIGFVEITHRDNPDLRDRTSREGLIDTAAFFDLKALVLAALSVLEVERFAKRRPEGITVKQASVKENDDLIESLVRAREAAGNGAKQGNGVQAALQEIEHLYKKRIEEEGNRYNQVSRLAGTGLAAELLTEAFARDVSNAGTIIKILEGKASRGSDLELRELVGSLKARMDRVSRKLDLMEPLYHPSINESDPIHVGGVVHDVFNILSNRLAETGTQMTLGGEHTLHVRINHGHLMQVLMMLVENALTAMKEARTEERLIEIKIENNASFKGLVVSDSGPGVAPGITHLIFQPYFSARQAGRGLGLHVVRDILEMYNCSINLVSKRSKLTGASFEIRFDGRRVV